MENLKEALAKVISARRSTRSYRPDEVPKELIAEIVEAGRLAPSGSNSQSTRFIVVTSPGKHSELQNAVTAALAAMQVNENMPPQLQGLINRAKQGPVNVGYGAPVLILTANKKGYANAVADCACALENMMLTAAACGLGSCWINQYYHLREAESLRACIESLGMAEDEYICGAVAIGYSDDIPTEPLPRTGNPVVYV